MAFHKIKIEHEQNFGIYHWDTFDDQVFLVDQASTLEDAENKVQDRYGRRIRDNGADQVDIVDLEGNIRMIFKVG